MELPAVPGPGVAGVKASLFAAAGFTVKLKVTEFWYPFVPLLLSWEFAVNVHEVVPDVVGAVPETAAVSLAPTVLPVAVKDPPAAHVIVQPVMAKLV
jgi:hypothetical protein